MVVGNSKAAFMFGKLGQGKDIEDLIREGGDERGLGEVFDCALWTYKLETICFAFKDQHLL